MNKLKLIISFILLISLFLGIVSCAPSPFDLSEEEKAGLEAAIWEEFHPDKTKPRPTISYIESNRYREWKNSETAPEYLCLGKYDDCVVFCSTSGGVQPSSTHFYLGKFKFHHVSSIWALTDNEIIYLSQAYNAGKISDASVEKLHDIFCKAFNYTPKYVPKNFLFTEDEKIMFEADVEKEFAIQGEDFFYLVNDIIDYTIEEKQQLCYGKFGDYIIFSFITNEEETGFYLGECYFPPIENKSVKAYKNGKFFTMEEAYSDGAFAGDDLRLFHKIFCNPHFTYHCIHDFPIEF